MLDVVKEYELDYVLGLELVNLLEQLMDMVLDRQLELH